MPSDAATSIAYVGAFVGLVGGGVSLFNTWKAVQWKRAELANSYIRDFNSNEELVFAGRCLDWYGGRLAVPEKLRAYLENDDKSIKHDRAIFREALRADLTVEEMYEDPRMQLYRVAIDSFLTWLGLVACALDRRLFSTADIEDVGYWVAKISSEGDVHGFISAFGYQENIKKLIYLFRKGHGSYRDWWFPSRSSIIDVLIKSYDDPDRKESYTFPSRGGNKSSLTPRCIKRRQRTDKK